MRYYKKTVGNYILSVGSGTGDIEITESNYNEIILLIQSRPQVNGKGYKLKLDLTWEEYDLPIEPITETTTEADMREALNILGVDVP